MQSVPVPVFSAASRIRPRTALVASADSNFRQRISEILSGLRWQVHEAEGGAQAWGEATATTLDAVIVDSWLPDLDLAEFLKDFRGSFPEVDLVTTGSSPVQDSVRGPYRQELLYALRKCQEADTDTAAWNVAPVLSKPTGETGRLLTGFKPAESTNRALGSSTESLSMAAGQQAVIAMPKQIRLDAANRGTEHGTTERLPELIGNAPCMLEISRRVRLVAP
ncbi:MAG: response regulator, partial [Terracidiphilus sp.]